MEENSTVVILSLLFIIVLTFIMTGWNGEYVERDIYQTNTEYQCLIDDEWTDVDFWIINLIGADWYKIDGVKTYVQGRELKCSRERVETFIETREVYNPGAKDILMFWEWGD